jgi:hypothetical protein
LARPPEVMFHQRAWPCALYRRSSADKKTGLPAVFRRCGRVLYR